MRRYIVIDHDSLIDQVTCRRRDIVDPHIESFQIFEFELATYDTLNQNA
jgi:hypothetical protein